MGIGFELTKNLDKKLGRRAFYDMQRIYGNQDTYLRNISHFRYLGAANSECDVFERLGGDYSMSRGLNWNMVYNLRCDDWAWDCSKPGWQALPFSALERTVDCGFGSWKMFTTKYNQSAETFEPYQKCLIYPGLEQNDTRCTEMNCGRLEDGLTIQFARRVEGPEALNCRGWGEQPTAGKVLAMVGIVMGTMIGAVALICLLLFKF